MEDKLVSFLMDVADEDTQPIDFSGLVEQEAENRGFVVRRSLGNGFVFDITTEGENFLAEQDAQRHEF